MSVNWIKFFNTTSRHTRFTTTEMIQNARQETLLKSIKNVVQLYKYCGFRIKELLMDGEFECLRGDLSAIQIELNTSSENEHVGKVERVNRTIK